MNISRVQLVRTALRVAPVTVVASALVLLQSGTFSQLRNSKLDSVNSSAQTQASPSPTNAPDIFVNGHKVDVGPGGAVDETLGSPGHQTQVSASGSQTDVSTQDNSGSAGPESSKPNNTNVSIDSGSNGALNITQVNSSSTNENSNGFSSGFSTTNVFSTSNSQTEQITH